MEQQDESIEFDMEKIKSLPNYEPAFYLKNEILRTAFLEEFKHGSVEIQAEANQIVEHSRKLYVEASTRFEEQVKGICSKMREMTDRELEFLRGNSQHEPIHTQLFYGKAEDITDPALALDGKRWVEINGNVKDSVLYVGFIEGLEASDCVFAEIGADDPTDVVNSAAAFVFAWLEHGVKPTEDLEQEVEQHTLQ